MINRKRAVAWLLIICLVACIAFATGYAVGAAEPQQQHVSKNLRVATEELPTHISLGEFTVTAYCDCEICCGKTDGITSTGTTATAGRTVAVDPEIIPYGTELLIDGKAYIAEDCGGAIKGNHIDIFFDSHEKALLYGVQTKEVYVTR